MCLGHTEDENPGDASIEFIINCNIPQFPTEYNII